MEQLEQQRKNFSDIIPLVDKDDFDDFDKSELSSDELEDGDERQKMIEFYEESMRSFKEGELVIGRVVNLSPDYITIDVGFKSEGTISLSEFPHNGRDIKVGEEVEVLIEQTENSEGEVVLSKEKADKIKIWDDIMKAHDNGDNVEGIVTTRIKGGLRVDIGGLKAFLPGSQVDLRPVKNLEKLVGQKMQLKVIKINKKRGNIILSRRTILEQERQSSRDSTLANLKEGKITEGVVKNITDYGAFVDLGGVDGLLHITDMSWGRISHPSELFAIGDKINVVILKYDIETEKVSLGYKQVSPDPWSNVDEKYPVGTKVRSKVVSITDYGLFIELERGIEGLIHVSEMSWNKYMKHPSRIVAISDMVDAEVLSLDKERKKISLSMKRLEPNPWENIDDRYPVGTVVEGRVRNLTDFGAFIELEDGIDGLIHTSDMSWTQKVKHPSEILKKRDLVKAVVLNVDIENEKISLGIRQLTLDPWENISEKFFIGMDVKGEVVKVTNFGAFVKIENGIEGLVHVSQITERKITNPKAFIKVGEKVNARIIKIDDANRRMGLSIKVCSNASGVGAKKENTANDTSDSELAVETENADVSEDKE